MGWANIVGRSRIGRAHGPRIQPLPRPGGRGSRRRAEAGPTLAEDTGAELLAQPRHAGLHERRRADSAGGGSEQDTREPGGRRSQAEPGTGQTNNTRQMPNASGRAAPGLVALTWRGRSRLTDPRLNELDGCLPASAGQEGVTSLSAPAGGIAWPGIRRGAA